MQKFFSDNIALFILLLMGLAVVALIVSLVNRGRIVALEKKHPEIGGTTGGGTTDGGTTGGTENA